MALDWLVQERKAEAICERDSGRAVSIPLFCRWSSPLAAAFPQHPIPGYENSHRLAKDSSGSPCLLLRPATAAANSPTPPIRLQRSSGFLRGSMCDHATRTGSRRRAHSRLSSAPAPIHRSFRIFCGFSHPLSLRWGRLHRQRQRYIGLFAGLVGLFQALTMPAKKSVQGLWAELFVIPLAGDSNKIPLEVVRAWHGAPERAYRFRQWTASHRSKEQQYPETNTPFLHAHSVNSSCTSTT